MLRAFLPVLLLIAQLSVQTAPSLAEEYRGKAISISTKKISLHSFFKLIAEFSKKNLVLHKDVQGDISLELRNVPWDQVLSIVLKEKQLIAVEEGSVLYIVPAGKVSTLY